MTDASKSSTGKGSGDAKGGGTKPQSAAPGQGKPVGDAGKGGGKK